MVLKLYSDRLSKPTLRVAAVLVEKNVPFELIAVDWQNGKHKTPEYLEKHPFGQLPYIDDGGFILYESRAICRYIAIKYREQGPALVPDLNDVQATALFEQAASVEQNDFEPHAYGYIYEKLGKPRHGLEVDQKVLDDMLTKLDERLNGYERILGKQKYLAGNEFTLADLFHLPWGTLLTEDCSIGLFVDDKKRPNLARWWKDISSRPAWLAVKDGIPV
ncbi:glutathione S-transferase [Trametopsis cervina]|nr:glutathione S-transferase [Trametopsis cervina]